MRVRIHSYIWENLRRSFAVWERSEAMSALGSFIVASAIGYLASAAFLLKWQLTAPQQFGIGLVVWFVVLMLLVTPYRMWAAEKEKVEKFENVFKPRLRINGPSELTRPKGKKTAAMRTFRIEIENLSGDVITNCRVQEDFFRNFQGNESGLMRTFMVSEEYSADPASFDYTQTFDLKGLGHRQIIDIVRLDETDVNSRVLMLYGSRGGSRTGDNIPRGFFPHELGIIVTADKLPEPVRKRFIIFIMDGLLRMEAIA